MVPTSGGYWNWNVVEIAPPSSHFTLTSGHTITFLVTGLYQITVTVGLTNTGNGNYMALYHNGTDISQAYRSDSSGYYNSWYINEIVSINANDTIRVYQTHNGSLIGGKQANKISVLML